MLFGVSAADAYALFAASLVILGVGIAATVLPARRVIAVDPVSTLRHE